MYTYISSRSETDTRAWDYEDPAYSAAIPCDRNRCCGTPAGMWMKDTFYRNAAATGVPPVT